MCVAVASLDSASAVSASTARHYAECSIQAIAGKALSRRLSTDHDPLTVERTVHTKSVVIASEIFELSTKIDRIPEECVNPRLLGVETALLRIIPNADRRVTSNSPPHA
jgi:hypothetical protein